MRHEALFYKFSGFPHMAIKNGKLTFLGLLQNVTSETLNAINIWFKEEIKNIKAGTPTIVQY